MVGEPGTGASSHWFDEGELKSFRPLREDMRERIKRAARLATMAVPRDEEVRDAYPDLLAGSGAPDYRKAFSRMGRYVVAFTVVAILTALVARRLEATESQSVVDAWRVITVVLRWGVTLAFWVETFRFWRAQRSTSRRCAVRTDRNLYLVPLGWFTLSVDSLKPFTVIPLDQITVADDEVDRFDAFRIQWSGGSERVASAPLLVPMATERGAVRLRRDLVRLRRQPPSTDPNA